MTLYKGNDKIRDTGSYGVYKGSQPIGAIFKGSEKVYLFQRSFSWQAGTTLASYTVPNYITKIHVDCVASRGYNGRNQPGLGGRVQCDLDVTGGQTLYITVGAIPTSGNIYNASDIRTNNTGQLDNTSLQSRLIVAGGGGYASPNASEGGRGGNGGGLIGQVGGSVSKGGGGGGGTQSAGGAGGGQGSGLPGWNGAQGSFGLGGYNVDWTQSGGSGWYGGGSGGASTYYDDGRGGGGGGSSYTNNSCSNVIHTQGYQNGAGYITITEIG